MSMGWASDVCASEQRSLPSPLLPTSLLSYNHNKVNAGSAMAKEPFPPPCLVLSLSLSLRSRASEGERGSEDDVHPYVSRAHPNRPLDGYTRVRG